MTVLIIILAILALLFLIAMLKVGVFASYSGEGAEIRLFAGPVRVQLLPKKKQKSDKKKKEKKPAKKKKKDASDEEKKEKKGGSAKRILRLLPGIGQALGNFGKKLKIDILKVYYTSASDDPFKTATGFGYASAGMGTITAFIKRYLKVKNLDLRTNVSFEETEPVVYLEAQLSIRIGACFIVALKFLIFFLKLPKDENNTKIEAK